MLVLISSRGPLNLNAVAQAMGVHPSNATRACDGLVNAGLLDRRDSPSDRRNVSLDLTPAGRELVQTMVAHRRDAIAQVLQRMPETRRRALIARTALVRRRSRRRPGPQRLDDGLAPRQHSCR